MNRSLVILTFCFCLGIFITSKINIPFYFIYFLTIAFFILSFISLKKDIRFYLFLSCLCFCLGASFLKYSETLAPCHIRNLISCKDHQPYIVKGFIDSAPVLNNNRVSFILKTEGLQSAGLNRRCYGKLMVYIKGKKDLRYGEEVILKGAIRFLGYKGYATYLRNQNIWLAMRVESSANILRLYRNKGWLLKRFALDLKAKLERIIFKYTSFIPASILDAMILGEKRYIPQPLYNSMIKSGTVHILVVSGFNVGIVTFVIILFLKLIRLSKRFRLYLTIPLLILYCLITGASVPVVRATVMAIVFIIAFLIKREPDIYNSLSMAALFILVTNPRQLFDIGFQLSFASVIAIVYLHPRLKSFLRLNSLKIKSIRFFVDTLLVSFSAWLGTIGLVAYYFKIFSPIAVLANLFIVPLVSLITLSGFSLITIHFVLPAIAKFFAYTVELLVAILFKINTILIKLPIAYVYLS